MYNISKNAPLASDLRISGYFDYNNLTIYIQYRIVSEFTSIEYCAQFTKARGFVFLSGVGPGSIPPKLEKMVKLMIIIKTFLGRNHNPL